MAGRALLTFTGKGSSWGLLEGLRQHLSCLVSADTPAAVTTLTLLRGVSAQGQHLQYSSSSNNCSNSQAHHCNSSCCSCGRPSVNLGNADTTQALSVRCSGAQAGAAWQLPRQLGRSPAFGSTSRSFASVSRASAHSGCGHSHHHHDDSCSDEVTQQIQQAADLEQLQQLLQQQEMASNPTAGRTAAAWRRAAVLANNTPEAADAVLSLLAPVWPRVLGQACGKDLADALLSWTKLRTQDEALWVATLAAVPAQIKQASGQDLANIAYALAAMSEVNGGVPGVARADVQELLRAVTEEVVSLVSGSPAGDGCGGGRSVSVGNLATVRWAHEVFEECGQAS